MYLPTGLFGQNANVSVNVNSYSLGL